VLTTFLPVISRGCTGDMETTLLDCEWPLLWRSYGQLEAERALTRAIVMMMAAGRPGEASADAAGRAASDGSLRAVVAHARRSGCAT